MASDALVAPDVLLRAQDLPAVYEDNSCLCLSNRVAFLQGRNRIGQRPLLFEAEATEAWDIAEESDFRVAEAMSGALHA
jgi:CMP-N-acetylneuraminic acid synthetase